MANQVETSSFIVRYENLGNDMYSMFFSVDGSDYENILPKCIYEKPNGTSYNYDSFRVNGWSSYKEEYKQCDLFCLFEFDLKVNDKKCRFNIVSWNDRIIHTRLLHTNYSSESLKIEKYSDSVVIITDFSKSKVFVDFSGNILLKTDGVPGCTYKELLRHNYYNNEMPYDLVTSSYFVLARINNQWVFFDNNLKKINVLDSLFDFKINGKCYGEYGLLYLYKTYEIKKTFVVYKDGSLIFSRDDDGFIEHIIEFEDSTDVIYPNDCGYFPVFRKGKYLFTIRNFRDADKLTVFYYETEQNHRYGVINRKLNIVVPPILEYVSILSGSIIKYKLNGKVGLWSESLSSIAPPKYQTIEPVESFFIAAMQGGFPNSFWSKWQHFYEGDGISYCTLKDDPEECVILKWNGEQSWPETFKNVYCEFIHYVNPNNHKPYDTPMAICIVENDTCIKFGIISTDGDFIIPPVYDYLEIAEDSEGENCHNPKAFKFAENARTEQAISPYGNEKYVINGGNYGLLSLNGSIVIPALYDAVTIYGDFVRVRKNDKYGLYSIDGRVLLDTMFSAINFMEIDGRTTMAIYNINGIVKGDVSDFDKYYSFGLADFSACGPNSYFHYSDNKVKIDGGMWGYYNLTRQLRGEALYTEVHPFDKGHAIVKYNDFYYLIDYNLKICSGAHKSLCCGRYCSANFQQNEDYYENSDYSSEELDQMYRDAFEGDPDAQWNID